MGSKLSTTFWSFNSSTSRPSTKKSLEVEENSQGEVVANQDSTKGSGRGENIKLEKLQIKKKNRRRKKRQKSKRKDKICVQEMNSSKSENNTHSTNLHGNKSTETVTGIEKTAKNFTDVVVGGVESKSLVNDFQEVKSRRGNKGISKKSDDTKSRILNGRVPTTIPPLVTESLLRSLCNNTTSTSTNGVDIVPVPQQNDGSRDQTETNIDFQGQHLSIDKSSKITTSTRSLDIKDGKQEVIHIKKQRPAEQASPYVNNIACEETMRGNKKLRTASATPSSRLYNGVKVTMIDEERKIFIIDLLNERTCSLIRNIAEEYIEHLQKSKVKSRNRNGDLVKGWRTLYTYTKMDLPCSEVKGLAENVTNRIMENIVKIVGEVYGKEIEASNLRPRSWKEPHLLKYQKYDGVM